MGSPVNLNLPKTDTSALYARFPHLGTIDLIWGSLDCRRYLSRLMTDTRGGQRQGFPREHAMTIMRLMMEHDQAFPQFEHAPMDTHTDTRWGSEPMRRRAGR